MILRAEHLCATTSSPPPPDDGLSAALRFGGRVWSSAPPWEPPRVLKDPTESRPRISVSVDAFGEHLYWAHPEGVVVVQLAVIHEEILGLGVSRRAEHFVALAFEMFVDARFDCHAERPSVHEVKILNAPDRLGCRARP